MIFYYKKHGKQYCRVYYSNDSERIKIIDNMKKEWKLFSEKPWILYFAKDRTWKDWFIIDENI